MVFTGPCLRSYSAMPGERRPLFFLCYAIVQVIC